MNIKTGIAKNNVEVPFHKVGEVYKSAGCYFLVVQDRGTGCYRFLNMLDSFVDELCYSTLEEMDQDNEHDVLVRHEVVVEQ